MLKMNQIAEGTALKRVITRSATGSAAIAWQNIILVDDRVQ